jgi:hypothetical protein
MAELTYICPDCRAIAIGGPCSGCGYDPADDQILIRSALDLHNCAIGLLGERRLDEAWRSASRSLRIYPYFVETLAFGVKLAREVGAFLDAQSWLQIFAPALSPEEYAAAKAGLQTDCDRYNALIGGDLERPVGEQRAHCCVLLQWLRSEPGAERELLRQRLAVLDAAFDNTMTPISPDMRRRQLGLAVAVICLALALTASLAALRQGMQNARRQHLSAVIAQSEADSLRTALTQIATVVAAKDSALTALRTAPTPMAADVLTVALNAGDWTTLAHILAQDRDRIRSLIDVLPAGSLNRLAHRLYRDRRYEDALLLGNQTSMAPHAHARIIAGLPRDNTSDVLKRKMAFVAEFPDFPCYTGSYLLDLVWSNLRPAPNAAAEYASQLKEYAKRHPSPEILGLVNGLPRNLR